MNTSRHAARRVLGSPLPRLAASAVLTLALVAALIVVAPDPATAGPTARVMATTQRMSDATLHSTQLGTYPTGAILELTCYKRGQAVQGYFSRFLPNGGWDDLWYRVADGSFVADVDIDTGSNNPVTGQCALPFASVGVPEVQGALAVGATVTAATGSWNPAPSFSYEWLLNGSVVTTGSSWLLPASARGGSIAVRITASAGGYVTTTQTSAARGPVSAGTLTGVVPTIAGTASVGSTVRATPGAWGPAPVALAYQWLRNGAPIPGATAVAYTIASSDVGKKVTVRVTGAKVGYAALARVSAAVVPGLKFTASPAPSIGGTGRVGQVLTATPGIWTPAPVALTYQWLRNGTAITGATAATYKIVAADARTALAVRVSGAKSGYTTVTRVSGTKAIEGMLTAVVPVATGVPTVGSILTTKTAAWSPSPVTLAYQWLRNGAAIPGATGATYKLTSADASTTVTVRVTGTKTGYTPAARASAGVAVGRAFTASPVPTVTGTPRVGQTLTAASGTWSPATVAIAYRWLRNGTPISGATARTYVLTPADSGASVSVRVTGSKSGYTSLSRTSKLVAIVPTTLTAGSPSIQGSATAGATLTADPGTWGPSPVTFTYSWTIDGSVVASGQTWLVPTWAAGKQVTVSVTGSKIGYASQSRASVPVTVSRNLGNRLVVGGNLVVEAYLRSGNGEYSLVLQGDGNLVLYRGGNALWSSRTAGQAPREFVLQGDSNLVLYRTDGRAIWASNTAGGSARDLVLQDDGNLVLYNTSGSPIWSSATSQSGGGGTGDGRLIVPFASGSSWYVCQGYNGAITHGGLPDLDLTTYSGRGSTGCWGGENDASGKTIYAPGSGSFVVLNNGLGGSCITLDGGGSVYLGHLNYSHGNGRVNQGDPLGTVAAANSAGNGGYAHLHLSARTGNGCGGTKVGFTSANNMKFQGMPDMPYSGASNQWAGQLFRR